MNKGITYGDCYVLLEENGTEAGVERHNTLILQDLGETTNKAASEGRLRHETDTSSLQRAQSNVGEELSKSGRDKVDRGSVVAGSVIAQEVDGLLLEELVTTELEGTLEEVTRNSGPKTRQQGTGAFILDDLTEAAEKTTVVGDRVQLDSGLDAIFINLVSSLARRFDDR